MILRLIQLNTNISDSNPISARPTMRKLCPELQEQGHHDTGRRTLLRSPRIEGGQEHVLRSGTP